jgi:hypothetical protein
MLIPEARWFGRAMKAVPDTELFPLLNVGSQSVRFREHEQPWLGRYVFAPLRKRGGQVVHTDIRQEEGVDLAGDLTDPAFLERLRSMRFRSVVCTNLLEHVEKPERIAATLVEVVEPGGRLFVSVPYRFPYHPDPIDTMFRPSVEELAGLFPGTAVERGEVVACGTLLTLLLAYCRWTPRRVMGVVMKRRSGGTTATAGPSRIKTLLPWCFRSFRTTCLGLGKPAVSVGQAVPDVGRGTSGRA